MHGTGVPGAYTGSKKLHRVLAPNTLASTFQTYEHFFLPYLVQVVENSCELAAEVLAYCPSGYWSVTPVPTTTLQYILLRPVVNRFV